MSIQWIQEACDRYFDASSGAKIIQLTSGTYASNNICCEQPIASADGARVALVRKADFSFDPAAWLLCVDLPTLRIGLVERLAVGVGGAGWSGTAFYGTPGGELTRVNLQTFEKSTYQIDDKQTRHHGPAAVSPDQRSLIYSQILPGSPSAGATVAIVRVDLKHRSHDVIFQHPEIINPHLQFNPVHGKRILVYQSRGSKLSAEGNVVKRMGDQGATLFVIDADGGNKSALPAGPPFTATCTGHQAFIADTGKVAFTAAWNLDDWSLDRRHPKGNLFIAAPGDDRPAAFEAPEHRFNHLSVSRCGRYFVADSHNDGLFDTNRVAQTTSLVVGNLQTGKYRTLVQSTMASGGGNQSTHAHPFFTADNRYVIYNADPYYAHAQVFAATIPSGFLESLA